MYECVCKYQSLINEYSCSSSSACILYFTSQALWLVNCLPHWHKAETSHPPTLLKTANLSKWVKKFVIIVDASRLIPCAIKNNEIVRTAATIVPLFLHELTHVDRLRTRKEQKGLWMTNNFIELRHSTEKLHKKTYYTKTALFGERSMGAIFQRVVQALRAWLNRPTSPYS